MINSLAQLKQGKYRILSPVLLGNNRVITVLEKLLPGRQPSQYLMLERGSDGWPKHLAKSTIIVVKTLSNTGRQVGQKSVKLKFHT
jgi:hypothetical protein